MRSADAVPLAISVEQLPATLAAGLLTGHGRTPARRRRAGVEGRRYLTTTKASTSILGRPAVPTSWIVSRWEPLATGFENRTVDG